MYLIIGQGAAGVAAANRLRALDPATAITMITDETDYFYSRIDLPDIVAGVRQPSAAQLQSEETFAARGITCLMGENVVRLLPSERMVELGSGRRLAYQKLLLATGSQPVVPKIPGVTAAGVHTIWTMHDALQLGEAALPCRHAVVIGAGLIGLKTALALCKRGIQTTVVEQQPRLLPRQLDQASSDRLTRALVGRGVEIRLNSSVEEIMVNDGVVGGVRLAKDLIPCDLVVLAVGVRPNRSLAEAAGLSVAGGILVDNFMRTSDPHIYAAGDVAVVVDRLTGGAVIPAIWPAAVEQGTLAAENMAGHGLAYPGSLAMNSVEIAGIPLVSLGDVLGEAGDDVRVKNDERGYLKLVLRQGILRGALLLGDISQAGLLAGLIDSRLAVDPERLLTRKFSFVDVLDIT